MVSSDSELVGIEVGWKCSMHGFNNCQKFMSSSTVIAFGFTEGMAVVSNDTFFTVAHLRKSTAPIPTLLASVSNRRGSALRGKISKPLIPEDNYCILRSITRMDWLVSLTLCKGRVTSENERTNRW